jgi:hypothetical protein
MTSEQWGVWAELWAGLPGDTGAVLLRQLARETNYPRPKDFMDAVRKHRTAANPPRDGIPAGSPLVQTLREQREYGHLLRGMTDQQITIANAAWEYQSALAMYGPGPWADDNPRNLPNDKRPIVGTVSAYFRWQREIGDWQGGTDVAEYLRRGMDRVHRDFRRPTMNDVLAEMQEAA